MSDNGYDREKDSLVAEAVAFQADAMNLTVQIWRYAGGHAKIQIARNRRDKYTGEMMFAKLGRMTFEEFAAVAKTVKAMHEKGEI